MWQKPFEGERWLLRLMFIIFTIHWSVLFDLLLMGSHFRWNLASVLDALGKNGDKIVVVASDKRQKTSRPVQPRSRRGRSSGPKEEKKNPFAATREFSFCSSFLKLSKTKIKENFILMGDKYPQRRRRFEVRDAKQKSYCSATRWAPTVRRDVWRLKMTWSWIVSWFDFFWDFVGFRWRCRLQPSHSRSTRTSTWPARQTWGRPHWRPTSTWTTTKWIWTISNQKTK